MNSNADRSWLLALDLTAQSRNTESGLISSLPTSAKFVWNNNSFCQNSICSTQSVDHHNNHHNHQNSESDSSTNGSACSCAPAFVRESSGFSDPTHGMSRSNGSSVERIPDDLLWTTDWHQSTALERKSYSNSEIMVSIDSCQLFLFLNRSAHPMTGICIESNYL